MARNTEIKAVCRDIKALEVRTALRSSFKPYNVKQDDTFFNCQNGRLKLRVEENERLERLDLNPQYEQARTFFLADPNVNSGQLIFYVRSDNLGPKTSSYSISLIPNVTTLRQVLEQSYGTIGRVKKSRKVYLIGQTRVHLDQVEGLGDFIELEVVLTDNQTDEEGVAIADEIMDLLDIKKEDLVVGAYLDLLKEKEGKHAS